MGRAFSTMAWGWHVETAINAIRLILSGAFDRAPGLQVILGHWGEMITFFLERIDEMFGQFAPATSFAQTFVEHFYVAVRGNVELPDVAARHGHGRS